MAAKKSIITPEFRVSYPKVFKAEPNKLKNNELEYSLMVLFPKGANLDELKKAAQEALLEKFGPEKLKMLKEQGRLRTPFRLQDEKEFTDEVSGKKSMPQGMEKGAVFLTVRTKQKPSVVDQSVKPIMQESDFYGGCYAIASLSVYAYEKGNQAGVNFGLKNVQKTRDGDPLGSRTRPEDDFAPISVPETEGAGSGGDASALFD